MRLTVELAELPLYAAVIVALALLLTAPVVAVKAPVSAPAVTVAEAGTVRVAFVFVRLTLAPPAGAALVSVTVQAVEEFGPTLVGVQDNADTSTGETRATLVFAELPLYAAVIVAVPLLLTAAVVALKVAASAPAVTVVDPGTLRVAFVFVRLTLAPPAGAALVSVTVQTVEEFGPTLVEVHDNADTSTDETRATLVLVELPL